MVNGEFTIAKPGAGILLRKCAYPAVIIPVDWRGGRANSGSRLSGYPHPPSGLMLSSQLRSARRQMFWLTFFPMRALGKGQQGEQGISIVHPARRARPELPYVWRDRATPITLRHRCRDRLRPRWAVAGLVADERPREIRGWLR